MIFLKKHALSGQKYMVSRTSLCFLKGKLVGYITLTADSISAKKVIPNVSNEDFEFKFSYPALKIARLAVDSEFERRGIGTHLLRVAMDKAVEISKSIGCRLVLVDSKKDAVKFYENKGFREAISKKNNYTPMYYDLQPVLLKLSSYAAGIGNSTANMCVNLVMSSYVGGSGSSTANIHLIDYNEKNKKKIRTTDAQNSADREF